MRKRRNRRRFAELGWYVAAAAIAGCLVLGAILTVRHIDPRAKTNDVETWVVTTAEKATPSPEPTDDPYFTQLVNWKNPIAMKAQGLVRQSDIFGEEVLLVNGEGSVNGEAGWAAKRMFEDAMKEGVGRYRLASAYRSTEYQDSLFNKRLATDDSYGRDPYNAPVKVMPGWASEHPTGLALDILAEAYPNSNDGYADTEEGRWLADNAHRYGFIMRYPRDKEHITGVIFEPWHYRYVGVDIATEIYEKRICLEEYHAEKK